MPAIDAVPRTLGPVRASLVISGQRAIEELAQAGGEMLLGDLEIDIGLVARDAITEPVAVRRLQVGQLVEFLKPVSTEHIPPGMLVAAG